MPSALVFGGAGQLGAAVCDRLLAAGWDVHVVTRGGRRPPAGVSGAGARLVDGTGRSRAAVIEGLGRAVNAVFDPTAYDTAAPDSSRACSRATLRAE